MANPLWIAFFLATLSLAHGKWLLKTASQNCTGQPWSVSAQNGNCVLGDGGRYEKISCEGNAATTHVCPSSNCHSGCKAVNTTPLNTCNNNGELVQCFEQEPPYAKYTAPHYVTDTSFESTHCQGDRVAVLAYALNTCVNINAGPTSYYLTCTNNTAVYALYNTADCSQQPVLQFPDGLVDKCLADNHLWHCF